MSETADYQVDGKVYEAAVNGRSDFRQAFSAARPIVKAAQALRDKWRTPGQRTDSDDFFAAIHAVCEAADEYDKPPNVPNHKVTEGGE